MYLNLNDIIFIWNVCLVFVENKWIIFLCNFFGFKFDVLSIIFVCVFIFVNKLCFVLIFFNGKLVGVSGCECFVFL